MIFQHLSGVELTALQLSHSVLDQFIKVESSLNINNKLPTFQTYFWGNAARLARLEEHWNTWIPSRVRTELGVSVTCLAHHDLNIFCGLKSGLVLVYDQNILPQCELEAHQREVLAMTVSAELLITVGRDLQMITWSVRHKVSQLLPPGIGRLCNVQTKLSSVTTPSVIHSLKIAGGGGAERVYLGCETGQITVLH